MNENHGTGPGGKREQAAGTAATEHPHGGPAGARREVGDAASSRRDPPHVTENDTDAPVQRQRGSGGPEIPVLPAGASGHDALTADERAEPIDPTSAYDRRPAEHKDLHPKA